MKKGMIAMAISMYITYLIVSAWGVLHFGDEIKDIMKDPNHWRRQR